MSADPRINVNSGNFLDYFGRDEEFQRHKKAELAKEYEAFKQKDEERFRNRFANKKNVQNLTEVTEPLDIKQTISGAIEIIKPMGEVEQSRTKLLADGEKHSPLEEKINAKLDDLLKRIDGLNQIQISSPQSTSQAIHTPTLSSNSNVVADQPDIFELKLQDRLRSLQDAEQRLLSIEQEYSQAKQTFRSDSKPPTSSIPVDMNVNNHIPTTLLKTSNIISNMSEDPSNILLFKYEQQQRYRKELEQQILEAKQKRKAEVELDKKLATAPLSFGMISGTKQIDPIVQPSNLANSTNSSPFPSSVQPTVIPDIVASSSTESYYNPFEQTQSASKNEAKKAKYAEELRMQMEDARKRKAMQKISDAEYDRKIEIQCATFHSTENFDPANQIRSDRIIVESQKYETSDETNHARGGHGIFGSPLSEEQKTTHKQYKEELAEQIEERRRQRELKERQEREADQREAERIATEQLRMQREFEEEQKRSRLRNVKNNDNDAVKSLKEENVIKTKVRVPEHKIQEIEFPTHVEKVPERSKTHHRRRQKIAPNKKDVIDDSLLIGEDTHMHQKHSSNSSQPADVDNVLKQLGSMRRRLNVERSRIFQSTEETTGPNTLRNDNTCQHFVSATKALPKVAKKVNLLFNISHSSSEEIKPTNFSVLPTSPKQKRTKSEFGQDYDSLSEKVQLACLKEQDYQLNEIVQNLDILTVRENLNNNLLERFDNSLDSIENFPASFKDSDVPTRPQSPSQQSLNVEEFNMRNEERLNRLQAMQLLSEIDTDHKAVLQRFLTKHDAPTR